MSFALLQTSANLVAFMQAARSPLCVKATRRPARPQVSRGGIRRHEPGECGVAPLPSGLVGPCAPRYCERRLDRARPGAEGADVIGTTCVSGIRAATRKHSVCSFFFRTELECDRAHEPRAHVVPSRRDATLAATGARIETPARRCSTAPEPICMRFSRLLRLASQPENLAQSRSNAVIGYAESIRSDPTEARSVYNGM